MSRLVFFPSDPIIEYIAQGKSYEYLEGYFNPGGYFEDVFCLSPWGKCEIEKIGGITYIRDNPCNFKKRMKQLKPDIIRGYGGYCCADWVSISKMKGIPTIVSVHDTNPNLIHDSLKYADYIVCMADCVRKEVLQKIEFDSDRIWIMPNRIDCQLFSRKIDLEYFKGLDDRFGCGRHILHIGRKCEQKNLDTLIKALKYIEKDISCIFVGTGDWEKYYNIAKKYDVDKRCFFVKSVVKEELPLWYSWCDCFCTPSRWEGFGFVFIEAAGCEAPIVTSDIAPMNEYLEDGLNAILVKEYENPQMLAAAIEHVLEGGDNIDRMKREARKVGLRFEKEKIDQEEIEIYKKAMYLGARNNENRNWKLKADIWKKYRHV